MSDVGAISMVNRGSPVVKRASVLQPKVLQRQPRTNKPWKGPLPPLRSNFMRSLGDLWVRERISGERDSAIRLVDWCEERPSMLPVGSPATEWRGLRRDPILKFKNFVHVPVRLDGPA
jgi:hypothetical protein